jgi:hypothetical protein
MFRYTPTTLQKLEQLFRESGFVVRYEKGNFKAGYCVLHDKRVAVINKYFDTESRINSLIDMMSEIEIDETKLTPKSLEFLRHLQEVKAAT